MSEALVIRLSGDLNSCQYLLVDAAGGRLGAVVSGALAQAAPLAAGRKVIAVLPGADAVLAEPELPAKSAARLAQLVPFALEELLATDIDAMHFAIGKRLPNGKTPVVAILKERMQATLAALAAAGLHADAMYVESQLVPRTTGSTLVVDRNVIYVAPALGAAYSLDVEPLEEALRLALFQNLEAEPTTSEPLLTEVQLYMAQADYEQSHNAIDAMRELTPNMQVKLLPEGALPLFALQAVQRSAVDLLCGPFVVKSSFNATLAPWKIAAALLGAAALLHFGSNGLQLWQLTRVERKLDAQIREVFAQTLPGASLSNTSDARKQFEARLTALQRGGVQGDLLAGLDTLGAALAQTPETRLEALAYRAQTIDLRITAPDVGALDKIQQAVNASGLSAQIQSATPRDTKVEGRLQLKTGA